MFDPMDTCIPGLWLFLVGFAYQTIEHLPSEDVLLMDIPSHGYRRKVSLVGVEVVYPLLFLLPVYQVHMGVIYKPSLFTGGEATGLQFALFSMGIIIIIISIFFPGTLLPDLN